MSKILEYFKGDELAADVWQSKYQLKDNQGVALEETPDDMHKRLAKEFSRIEESYQKNEPRNNITWNSLSHYGRHRDPLDLDSIYQLFKDFKYIIPQGSIMSQLGANSIGSLSNCFNGDVQVLTRFGWRKIYQLSGNNEEIMTKGGVWVHAPFKCYGEQSVLEVKLSNGNQEKSLRATKDHRWAIFKKSKPEMISEIKTTEQLKEGDILYSTYGKQRNFKLSSVGIAHGITFGDGHTVQGRDNCNNITLCADSRVLGKYFPESYVSSDENLCEGGSDFYSGLPNYFRDLPNILENKSYLYGWLAGYFAADGHIDENGSTMICSVNSKNIEFVRNICGVLGIGCTDITNQTVISNLTNEKHTMYKCFIHKNHLSEDFFLLDKHKVRFSNTGKEPARWKVISVSDNKEHSMVYCAEVPETESFVIEGNILSMNCFVVGQPVDSYGGIYKKDQELAQLMKRRGGVGIDISTLRPEGTTVTNAAKYSSGAISFMHRFSNTTREVAQKGRRGALMISIDINHPDVLEFIKIKRDLSQVTGANISIKLNKEFMQAVERNEDYLLRFPCNSDISDVELNEFEYNILYNHSRQYFKKIKAKEYWDEIIKSAHGVAEPGLMFWDNMIDYSPDGVYEQYKAITTNPCSEIGMQMYDACRLICVNLFSFVDKPFTSEATFDFEKFYQINYEAMRLSDDLIDLELEHIDRIVNKIKSDPESDDIKQVELDLWVNIRATAEASRRTGLGFTALADTLAALGLSYDSDVSLAFTEDLMRTKMKSELDCTIDLSILRGPFDNWSKDMEFTHIYHGEETANNLFYQMLNKEFPEQAKKMRQYGRRNVSWSTVAPTGTVSIMTQTTSGIEPLFMPFYMRRKKINPSDKDSRVDFIDQNGDKWQEFPILHPKFKDWIITRTDYTEQVEANIISSVEELNKATLQSLFEQSPWYKSTANDIDWIKRVEIQAIIQKYISHSISSTINLPGDVSEEEVSKIYMESWKKGLKGITVYRDGCRSGVLVSTTEKKAEFDYHDAPKRPKSLKAKLHTISSKGKKFGVVVGFMNERPYELFAFENPPCDSTEGEVYKIKRGHYNFVSPEYNIENLQMSAELAEEQLLCRWISMLLRHGARPEFVIDQVSKSPLPIDAFGKVVIRVLKKYIPDGTKSTVTCNECGDTNVVFEEGCQVCKSCGNSKCG